MTRYCVIGAGAAGLSALHQLREAGYEVDCFEKTGRVGGHWNTNYEALHLITSRDTTYFEGFPMPAHYPHFPRRTQVLEYMQSYAREHGLDEVIQFNTEIASVEPISYEHISGELTAEGDVGAAVDTAAGTSFGAHSDSTPVGALGWRVTLATGEQRDYDGVIVANGHLWDQKIPNFPGEFAGKTIHSGSYQNTGELDGERVLVVGVGNSGCDLAVDAAQHRFEVDIVVREGTHFQSKTYFGMPRQELPWLAEFTPDEVDLISRLLSRVTLGDATNYPGLPTPKSHTLAEGRAVVNDLLLYWVQHGRIGIVPGIERFDGHTVHFTDGTQADYGTILWATGFHASVPFLDERLVERGNGVPLRYAGGIVPKGLEKLYYVGLAAPRGPQIPVYGTQMKRVITMIKLHEAAGGFAGVQEYLASLQQADDCIDIVRAVWDEQLADTDRLLAAFETARAV